MEPNIYFMPLGGGQRSSHLPLCEVRILAERSCFIGCTFL